MGFLQREEELVMSFLSGWQAVSNHMVFGPHWTHLREWGNSFILKCKCLHYFGNSIPCKYLNFLWKYSDVDLKCARECMVFQICGRTRRNSLKAAGLEKQSRVQSPVREASEPFLWAHRPGAPARCGGLPCQVFASLEANCLPQVSHWASTTVQRGRFC